MRTQLVQLATAATLITGSALAGSTAEPVVMPPAPPSDSAWEFRIEPYGWLTGMNGTISKDTIAVDIDKSFGDIVGNLKMAAALQMEARNGRWGIMADGFYAALGASGDAQSPLTGNGKVDLKQFIGELDLGYRIYENSSSFIDLIGGVRYNALKLDLEVDVAGAGPGSGKSGAESADQGWTDPLVGIRGQWNFGERWFLAGKGDIGGFGVGSDLAWCVQGTVGYQFTKLFSTELGYRYFDTDFRDGDFKYDLAEHGLFVGFNFTF